MINLQNMSPMEIVALHTECEQRIDKARRDLLEEAIRKAGGQRALAREMNYAVENLNSAINGGRAVGAALTERVVKYLQGTDNGKEELLRNSKASEPIDSPGQVRQGSIGYG